MLLQLKSGFTIEIPIETYLDMSDEELQELECLNYNQLMEINNPFHKPYADKTKKNAKKEDDDPHAIYNVSDQEKLKDHFDQEKEDY
tara:strand:- start:613 stop:873 length:261 start_codon:yes stop_codon:yes gene_type:complete